MERNFLAAFFLFVGFMFGGIIGAVGMTPWMVGMACCGLLLVVTGISVLLDCFSSVVEEGKKDGP